MSDSVAETKSNISEIRERIRAAAERSGRRAEDVGLIAVTKTYPPEAIYPAIQEGIFHLGENRVQELCDKYDIIKEDVKWHLIGHLQTNKVKYIIDKVHLIHSVDSMELVKEIHNRAGKSGKTMDILIQINVSGEESKFGIPPESVMDYVKDIGNYENVRLKGLMTIAPYTPNPEEIRHVFRGLRKIFIDIKALSLDNIDMEYLSMGMSNDFEVAIEEGANLVRIGSAIFGQRSYM